MASKIQPFEISTTGALRKRLLSQMPDSTRLERAHVATLEADAEGWCAIDAPYFRLGDGMDRIGSAFKTREPLRVFVDKLVPPQGRVVIAAVEVRTNDLSPSAVRALDIGVSVDFRQLMIARSDALARCWKVGGARCRANLLHEGDRSAAKKTTQAELGAAAKLLRARGLRVTQGDAELKAMARALEARGYSPARDETWYLEPPVTDEELATATEILRQQGSQVTMNVARPHSGAQIDDALKDGVTALLTERDETFGFALRPGFGNGSYRWDELLAGNRLVGHRMEFLRD